MDGPWDAKLTVQDRAGYYEAVPQNPCRYQPERPFEAKFDGANCLIQLPEQLRSSAGINPYLYYPGAKVGCPRGGWFDGQNCKVMDHPGNNNKIYRWPDKQGGNWYYHGQNGQCPKQPETPFKAVWDGANCWIQLPDDIRNKAGNSVYLYYPAEKGCPAGGWFDGSNCKVMDHPPTGRIFKWEQSGQWYYPPDRTQVACPYQPSPFAVSLEGTRCRVRLPSEAKPFIHENKLYYVACRSCNPITPFSQPPNSLASRDMGPLEPDSDRFGMDYRTIDASQVEQCQAACLAETKCQAFSYAKPGTLGTNGRCWLKEKIPPKSARIGFMSAAKTASGQPALGAIELNTDRFGMDYQDFIAPDVRACQLQCANEAQCRAFSFAQPGTLGPQGRCWLKHTAPPASPRQGFASGVK
jgi:hypothetical protein